MGFEKATTFQGLGVRASALQGLVVEMGLGPGWGLGFRVLTLGITVKSRTTRMAALTCPMAPNKESSRSQHQEFLLVNSRSKGARKVHNRSSGQSRWQDPQRTLRRLSCTGPCLPRFCYDTSGIP